MAATMSLYIAAPPGAGTSNASVAFASFAPIMRVRAVSQQQRLSSRGCTLRSSKLSRFHHVALKRDNKKRASSLTGKH